MGPPDFKAFEQYTRALGAGRIVTIIPAHDMARTRDYIHLDASAYAAANPRDQKAAGETFTRRFQNMGADKDAMKNIQSILTDAKTKRLFVNEAGGMAYPDIGTWITDDRAIKMGPQISNVMRYDAKDVSTLDRYKTQMTKLHEAAHVMLGTGEAGSDFVAAAIMLRDQPASRDMLRTEADLRLVSSLQQGPANLALYGLECHDAIERALSMTPEQLKSASIETLHGIGADYDFENEMNAMEKEKSPEGRALAKITNYTGKGQFDGSLKKSWDTATAPGPQEKDYEENMRYNLSSPAQMVRALRDNPSNDPADRKIAEKLEASVGRLNAYVAGPERTAPKPENAPVPSQ